MAEEKKVEAQEVVQEDPLAGANLDLTPEEEEQLRKAELGEAEEQVSEEQGGDKKPAEEPKEEPQAKAVKWEDTPEYQGFKRSIYEEREKRRQLESQIEELNRKLDSSAGKGEKEDVSGDDEEFLTKGDAKRLLAQLEKQATEKAEQAKKKETANEVGKRIETTEEQARDKYKDRPAGLDYDSAVTAWEKHLESLPQASRVAALNYVAASDNPAETAYQLALQAPGVSQKFAKYQALELIQANRNKGTAIPKTSGAPQAKASTGPMSSEEEIEAELLKTPEQLEAEARAIEEQGG